MSNPIPRSSLFATPSNFEAVEAFIERLPKSHRAETYTAVMMALNLAHKLVEDAKQEAKGAW